MKPEELKNLLADIKEQCGPMGGASHHRALLVRAGKAIEFMMPINEVPNKSKEQPEIIASEPPARSQWEAIADLGYRIDDLFERVTTLDNHRFEQARDYKELADKEFKSVWVWCTILSIGLFVTVLGLVKHIINHTQ